MIINDGMLLDYFFFIVIISTYLLLTYVTILGKWAAAGYHSTLVAKLRFFQGHRIEIVLSQQHIKFEFIGIALCIFLKKNTSPDRVITYGDEKRRKLKKMSDPFPHIGVEYRKILLRRTRNLIAEQVLYLQLKRFRHSIDDSVPILRIHIVILYLQII